MSKRAGTNPNQPDPRGTGPKGPTPPARARRPERPGHPGLPATTGELADALRAAGTVELQGPADLPVRRLDAIDHAGPGSVTFVRNAAFASRWPGSDAVAVIISKGIDLPDHPDPRRAVLIVENADHAIFHLLSAASAHINAPLFDQGIHPTAFVHPTATVDPTAAVGPFCSIGRDASVGPGAVLESHVAVGADSHVGARTRIHESVVLRPMTTVGEDCLLHPGTVIGADGFGFDRDHNHIPVFVPHIAGVTIGDRVVIGGNCSIDRGKFSDTVIGDDVKIDNLTQIGHATRVGRGTVICGCCALGGSCRIGDYVTIGGGVHMPDNVDIEDHAIAAGGAFLSSSIEYNKGEPWMGHPARPRSAWLRELRALKSFQRVRKDLQKAMREIADLRSHLGLASGNPADTSPNTTNNRSESSQPRA